MLAGTGQTALIKALTHNQPITELASQAEVQLKDLMHEATGVGVLKPTSVRAPPLAVEQGWAKPDQATL